MPAPARRDLISLDDLDDDDLHALVRRGAEHAEGRHDGAQPLRDDIVGVLFRKTSTRTRTVPSLPGSKPSVTKSRTSLAPVDR